MLLCCTESQRPLPSSMLAESLQMLSRRVLDGAHDWSRNKVPSADAMNLITACGQLFHRFERDSSLPAAQQQGEVLISHTPS